MRPYVRLQFNVLFIRALFMVSKKNNTLFSMFIWFYLIPKSEICANVAFTTIDPW